MTRWIAALPFVLLAACETSGNIGGGDFEAALDGHKGLTERELVRKFGEPLSTEMQAERKLMTWGPTSEVYVASPAPSTPVLSGGDATVLPIMGDFDSDAFQKTCPFTYELEQQEVTPDRPQTEMSGMQFVAVAWSYDAESCGL